MSAFLREIPLLVWLAVCFAAAWCAKAVRGKRRRNIRETLRQPPVWREVTDGAVVWRVNLRTGGYRRIV